MLLPVHPGVELDVPAVRIEVDILDNSGVEEFPLDPQSGADGAFLDPFHGLDVVHQPGFLRVVDFNVPVVVVDGLVLISLQDIAQLAGFQDLTVGLFVKNGGEEAFFVPGDVVEGGLDAVFRKDKGRSFLFGLGGGEGLPAFGGDIGHPADGALSGFLDRIHIAAFVL